MQPRPLCPARASSAFLRGWPRTFLITFLSLAALLPAALRAQDQGDFSDLSLEELIQVEISSLGRKNSTVFDTPAPAYIVSNDEIHRSGALNLPEVLRLVPGVQVSRVDSANYAITIRGFNDFSSNKLLVLKDGRSVYNQLFSGANWTFQEAMLADVSRVEVQRGPAGTLWGANAVNGVINLVSKNAHSTIGSLLSVSSGDQFDAAFEARYGWNINLATAARVYAKYQNQGDYGTTAGSGSDGWNSRLVGTRIDWDRPGGGGLTVIAEHREVRISGDAGLPTLLPPYVNRLPDTQRTRGTDLSLKWTQPVFSEGHLSVQASIERGDTSQRSSGEHHTTADLDAQLTLHPRPHHEVITGVTYRSTADNLKNTPWFMYTRPAVTTTFIGAFAQDEITLIPETLSVTLGTKIERNSYSGWETQPSVRLLWHPTKTQTLWAAVSQAARTPSRAERDVHWFAAVLPPDALTPIPGKVIALGDPNFSSEHVTAFETGHRFQPSRNFSIDTSVFYSDYQDLRGLNSQVFPPDFTSFPFSYTYQVTATNNISGHTYGGELAVKWSPARNLRFDASVASVRASLVSDSGAPDTSIGGLIGNTPHEEYKFHAAWDLNETWALDLFSRHTGRLTESGVPAYTGLEARLSWRPRKDWEVELIGRDLLDQQHPEISSFFIGTDVKQIARSVYLRVTYKH